MNRKTRITKQIVGILKKHECSFGENLAILASLLSFLLETAALSDDERNFFRTSLLTLLAQQTITPDQVAILRKSISPHSN